MDSCKYTDSMIDHLMDFSTLKMATDVAQEPGMLVHLNNGVKSKRNPYPSSFKIMEFDDHEKLAEENHTAGVIVKYREHLEERTSHQLGYPCYLGFDYGALSPLLSFSIINLGDPFIDASYGIHSRQFEVGVLDWFARLWELEENEYWGYVTSCGSEGNFHGILIGRELFSNGVLYASRESHYSVFKAARLFRMDCVKVKTLVSGELDYSDFKTKLLQNKGRPAIVNVNIGTTVKAAIDDLDLVINILEESGFTDRFYIHCDGALLGLMLPFMNQAPKISFKKPIGSVSISGHKFLGSPLPCGVQMTRMSHIKALSRKVECIGSEDTTIMGSRNGHAPILLWYALSRRGRMGLHKEVERCLENAKYLKNCLRREGVGAMLNEFSNTVVFERPRDEKLVRKWQLLCEGKIAHIVVMPNVTVETLRLFVSELVQSRLVLSKGGVVHPPCIAAEVGDENCGCFVHLHYNTGK